MDLLGTLASWASIVGLVFSVLAFVFSKRASKAAGEARDSVLLKSLSQDMSEANRTATEIVGFVDLERGDMALLKARELLNHVSYCVNRWDAKLAERSKNRLLEARERLISIHSVLTTKSIPEMSPSQQARLAQSCQHINVIFSEEHGTAVKAADEAS